MLYLDLFPVIEDIYEFIVLKLFHILGDMMHNWLRRSSIYFKYSSHFQQTYLLPTKFCFIQYG